MQPRYRVAHLFTLLVAAATPSLASLQDPSTTPSPEPPREIFHRFQGDPRLKKVGVVGLRNGYLAAFSAPGQEWTFFEIDPDVKAQAEDARRFPHLRDARGKIRIELGDGRLLLQRSKDRFGLLLLDAFSPDAIPVHLITREAVALYQTRLEPRGLLAFQISSKLIDLESVLATIAADAKWLAFSRVHVPTEADRKRGITESHWVVLARQKEDVAPLLKSDAWRPLLPRMGAKAWTDDYANILEALRKQPKH